MSKPVKLKRIGVLSLAKFYAIMMGIMGLIIGIFIAFIAIISSISGSIATSTASGQLGLFAGLGFLGIVIIPLFYATLGFIIGVVSAFLYNLIAGWIGGIEVEIE